MHRVTVLDTLLDARLSEGFEEGKHPRDWRGRFKALSILRTMRPGDTRKIEGVKVERQKNGDFTVHHPPGSPRAKAHNSITKAVADPNLASPEVAADSLGSAIKGGKPKTADGGRDGYKVGDRVRVKGRGEEGGHYEVTGAHPASPLIELTSKRSGRKWNVHARELDSQFERVSGRPTYQRKGGEIAPPRAPTLEDHKRAGRAVDSPARKARSEEISRSVASTTAKAKAKGMVEDKYGRLRYPADIPPEERKASERKSKAKRVSEREVNPLLGELCEVFSESQHKRGAKGTSQGGKFVAMGASGSQVQNVQKTVGAKVDGAFGYNTRASVMAYQRKHGLTVDGVVGHQTAAAMQGQKNASKVKTGALTAADRKALGGKSVTKAKRASSTRKGTAPSRPAPLTPRQRLLKQSRAGGGIIA